MKKGNFHMIIYSELLEYGGGRETWFSYFLPNIIKVNLFDNIFVYYLKPRIDSDSLARIPFISNYTKVEFIPINIGIPEKNSVIKNFLVFSIFAFNEIRKRIKKNDLILLVGSGMEATIGFLLKSIYRNKIKLFTWVRSITIGELKTRKSSIYTFSAMLLENIVLKLSDKIIANGYDTYNYYKKKLIKTSEKIVIIENAVEYEKFSRLNLPNFSDRPIKIAYIGRINDAKGFNLFIESIKKFKIKYGCLYKDIEFHVWGGYNKKYEALDNLVIFHRHYKKEDIYDILSSLHVVVFLNRTGLSGGISHALLEAMAAGRLIIAWDNYIHSQIINNNNGILVPDENLEMLTDTYYKILLLDENIFLDKCINAREKAKEFSIENHINKFLSLV